MSELQELKQAFAIQMAPIELAIHDAQRECGPSTADAARAAYVAPPSNKRPGDLRQCSPVSNPESTQFKDQAFQAKYNQYFAFVLSLIKNR